MTVRHARRAVVISALVMLPAAGMVVAGCGSDSAGTTAAATTTAARNAAAPVPRYTTGQRVVARVGTTFMIVLVEQPSTGYVWDLADGSDGAGIVEPVGNFRGVRVTQGEGGPAPQVVREFTYAAVKQGQVALKYEYKRPWESAPISIRSFDVRVVS
ncbi:MAG: protease inhibitor I42 family protein [Actinobacteria bacterium]|nr:protease inhibitor I42 family protein [Actinomycetota bacterium]MBM3697387.1 protease inhibitor I42 family protein [Actinomycetota bacterium]